MTPERGETLNTIRRFNFQQTIGLYWLDAAQSTSQLH